jgi:ubiquinone biosynthesis protein
MFKPYKSYRYLRRYKQIILTVGRYGFGELISRLKLLKLLKLRKPAPDPELTAQATRAQRFRLMLEQLGPTFIKLGQILSTRADLLPDDIVTELAQLRDNVAPTPWETVRKQLRGDSDDYFETSFARFNTEPIASASIAQVYEAQLNSGEKVAVKIIRPGTEKAFKDDLLILEHLANLIHTHIEETRHWDLHAVLSQLRVSVNNELDMRHEGRNADIFRGNFADDPRVYVPKIYWDYCRNDILVMEFIEGRRLSEFFDADIDPATRQKLARNGADIVLRQIFEHGFFQADPHPGNAFVMPGDVICFLDFGMFGRLDRGARNILGRVLQAIVKKDIDRIFKAARDLDVLSEENNQAELKVATLDLIEQYHGIPLKQINVRRMLSDIIRLINHFNIRIRHDFLFLIKALGTIEATGNSLDPEFDMLTQIKPYVRSIVTRRYTPQHILDESQRFGEDMVQLARESPEHLLEILRHLRAGRLKMEFQHRGLEQSLQQLNRISDKAILGLIIAALIIASSVIAHANIGPKWFGYPVIGGFGFMIAGIAGIWIIFDILRNRGK